MKTGVSRVFFLIIILLLSACNTSVPAEIDNEVSTSALKRINYRNVFREWNPNLSNRQVQNKLNQTWNTYFVNPQTKLYFTQGNDRGYIKDFYNNDVRSEGMSYGMMIAVQMNKKEVFDRLWNYAHTYMRHPSGPRRGYFAWRVSESGKKLDDNSAPDGEIYMAMALYFASGRWGNGQGIYNYQAKANQLLRVMLHKEDQNGGIRAVSNVSGASDRVTNMFQFDNDYHSGADYNQVVFVPSAVNGLNEFTDPSYHLPAFYHLFSQWSPRNSYFGAPLNDRQRWRKIRDASRFYFFEQAINSRGLTSDYANFDGSPKTVGFNANSNKFSYDSWRVGMNWGVDQAWFNPGANYGEWADDLQDFMRPQIGDLANTYELNGRAVEDYPGTDPGLLAMVTTAGLAATKQGNVKTFAEALWNASAPTDPSNRYYSGLLYFMGLLNMSGQYRIYCPPGLSC